MAFPEISQLESDLSEMVARFHREQQGREPKCCEAHLLNNMAIIRSSGIFTLTEETLSQSEEGQKLIQSARREQRALTRRQIEGRVARLLGRKVERSYYDIDVRNGEQIEVYMLD